MTIDARTQLPYLRANFVRLASESQPLWHPLGFVSCVVRTIENEFTTRVHYWPKNERRCKNPDWPIHTHAYELSSLILEGRVRDAQYRKHKGSDYTIYSVSYAGEDSAITRTEDHTSIETIHDRVRQAGEEYSVPKGVFHQTIVPKDESAVTLVVLSDFTNTVPPLVLGEQAEQCYPYDRSPFSKSEFWDRVEDGLKNLDEHQQTFLGG